MLKDFIHSYVSYCKFLLTLIDYLNLSALLQLFCYLIFKLNIVWLTVQSSSHLQVQSIRPTGWLFFSTKWMIFAAIFKIGVGKNWCFLLGLQFALCPQTLVRHQDGSNLKWNTMIEQIKKSFQQGKLTVKLTAMLGEEERYREFKNFFWHFLIFFCRVINFLYLKGCIWLTS